MTIVLKKKNETFLLFFNRLSSILLGRFSQPLYRSSDLSWTFVVCFRSSCIVFSPHSLALCVFLFLLCGKSVMRMIECVACFSANNCRRVHLVELHRRGDGKTSSYVPDGGFSTSSGLLFSISSTGVKSSPQKGTTNRPTDGSLRSLRERFELACKIEEIMPWIIRDSSKHYSALKALNIASTIKNASTWIEE